MNRILSIRIILLLLVLVFLLQSICLTGERLSWVYVDTSYSLRPYVMFERREADVFDKPTTDRISYLEARRDLLRSDINKIIKAIEKLEGRASIPEIAEKTGFSRYRVIRGLLHISFEGLNIKRQSEGKLPIVVLHHKTKQVQDEIIQAIERLGGRASQLELAHQLSKSRGAISNTLGSINFERLNAWRIKKGKPPIIVIEGQRKQSQDEIINAIEKLGGRASIPELERELYKSGQYLSRILTSINFEQVNAWRIKDNKLPLAVVNDKAKQSQDKIIQAIEGLDGRASITELMQTLGVDGRTIQRNLATINLEQLNAWRSKEGELPLTVVDHRTKRAQDRFIKTIEELGGETSMTELERTLNQERYSIKRLISSLNLEILNAWREKREKSVLVIKGYEPEKISIEVIKAIEKLGGKASISELSETMGKSPGFVSSVLRSINFEQLNAERIMNNKPQLTVVDHRTKQTQDRIIHAIEGLDGRATIQELMQALRVSSEAIQRGLATINFERLNAWRIKDNKLPLAVVNDKAKQSQDKVIHAIEKLDGRASLTELKQRLSSNRSSISKIVASINFEQLNAWRMMKGELPLVVMNHQRKLKQDEIIQAIERSGGRTSFTELAKVLGKDIGRVSTIASSIDFEMVNAWRARKNDPPLRLFNNRTKRLQDNIISFIESKGGRASVVEIARALHLECEKVRITIGVLNLDIENTWRRFLGNPVLLQVDGMEEVLPLIGAENLYLPKVKNPGAISEENLEFYSPDRVQISSKQQALETLGLYQSALRRLISYGQQPITYTHLATLPDGLISLRPSQRERLRKDELIILSNLNNEELAIVEIVGFDKDNLPLLRIIEAFTTDPLPSTGNFRTKGSNVTYNLELKVIDELIENLQITDSTGHDLADILLGLQYASNSATDRSHIEQCIEELRQMEGDEDFELMKNDQSQMMAIALALYSQCRLLHIKGPFGSGKTGVISWLSRHFSLQGKRVFLTSQMNQAVDRAASKLMLDEEIPILRLGNNSDSFRYFTQYIWIRDRLARDRFNANYASTDGGAIFCGTNIGINTDRTIQRIAGGSIGAPDVIIIDEVSRDNLAGILAAIRHAGPNTKLILVGDIEQLPPYKIPDEIAQGADLTSQERIALESSILTLLEGTGRYDKVMLSTAWRNHTALTVVPSYSFYDGEVNMRYPDILEEDTLKIIDTSTLERPHYEKEDEYESKYNTKEADLVIEELIRILSKRYGEDEPIYEANEVTIITPYEAQSRLIRSKIIQAYTENKDFSDLLSEENFIGILNNIHTIDSFQGGESQVVILSLVRSQRKAEKEIGFVKDMRRLNVALTRAIEKLTVIGDFDTLTNARYTQQDREAAEVFKFLKEFHDNTLVPILTRSLNEGLLDRV